jgi:hypothetical protein
LVIAKAFRDEASEGGKEYGEFVNKSWQDISGLAQFPVIPATEKRAGKMIPLV